MLFIIYTYRFIKEDGCVNETIIPSFNDMDCFGCQHTTSVAVSLLKRICDIRTITNTRNASQILSDVLIETPATTFNYQGLRLNRFETYLTLTNL